MRHVLPDENDDPAAASHKPTGTATHRPSGAPNSQRAEQPAQRPASTTRGQQAEKPARRQPVRVEQPVPAERLARVRLDSPDPRLGAQLGLVSAGSTTQVDVIDKRQSIASRRNVSSAGATEHPDLTENGALRPLAARTPHQKYRAPGKFPVHPLLNPNARRPECQTSRPPDTSIARRLNTTRMRTASTTRRLERRTPQTGDAQLGFRDSSDPVPKPNAPNPGPGRRPTGVQLASPQTVHSSHTPDTV